MAVTSVQAFLHFVDHDNNVVVKHAVIGAEWLIEAIAAAAKIDLQRLASESLAREERAIGGKQ